MTPRPERDELSLLRSEVDSLHQEVTDLANDLALVRRRYRSLRGAAERTCSADARHQVREIDRLRRHLVRLRATDRILRL